SNGTVCNGTTYDVGTTSNPKYFGIDQTLDNTDIKLYAVWTASKYDITLTNTNATTNGSTSAYTTYSSSNVYAGTASSSGTSTITSPQRAYSFSGFSKTNSAYDASVSSTATKTYTYVFDGWYTASSGGNKVITSSGALVANAKASDNTTTLVDSNGNWVYDTTSNPAVTLYAHWTAGTSQTLPTITQTDSTNGNGNCYWSSTNSTTGAQTYASGATISSPTAGATLYGVCKFPVKITFAGTGVSSVAVKSGSATGTTVGTVSSSGGSVTDLAYGTNYYLVPTYTSGYELSGWSKTSTSGTLSSTTEANPYITIGTTSTTGAVGVTVTGKSAKTYMQDLTKAQCQSQASSGNITVYDRRDESDYTVRYIRDACWMTQNLRITGTISSTDSNFSTNSTFNVKAADLKGSSSSYTQAQSHVADSTDVSASSSATGGPYTINQLGAWYNYCSASAGTVCSQTQKDATEDICPSGWHLPSYNTAPGAFSGMTGTVSTTGTNNASYFSPIYGGSYYGGSSNRATTYGYWWSATAYNASNQYNLYYSNGSLGTGNGGKRYGYYVRCVRTS
ncbi:hypothetical protein IJG04_03020, partial [Candidatus Saccharibacteria bacterium]|nr:hypothetical protein [Candidatus Saccharibacteria bacterium]